MRSSTSGRVRSITRPWSGWPAPSTSPARGSTTWRTISTASTSPRSRTTGRSAGAPCRCWCCPMRWCRTCATATSTCRCSRTPSRPWSSRATATRRLSTAFSSSCTRCASSSRLGGSHATPRCRCRASCSSPRPGDATGSASSRASPGCAGGRPKTWTRGARIRWARPSWSTCSCSSGPASSSATSATAPSTVRCRSGSCGSTRARSPSTPPRWDAWPMRSARRSTSSRPGPRRSWIPWAASCRPTCTPRRRSGCRPSSRR